MNESKEKLRADFYARTDITPGNEPCSWKNYAEYLEELAVEKINAELLRKNERYSDDIEKVVKILEESIMSR